SKRRHSPISSKPLVSLRPNRRDAEIEERTRQRAYELYQERGGVDGNPTDDWLQAKQEVLRHKARAGTPPSNQFSRSSQLPAQRGCFPCRLENSGPAYRTKR